jgi:hypothetical protein
LNAVDATVVAIWRKSDSEWPADRRFSVRMMEEPGRFLVLEKFGPAEEVVAHLDPRGPTRRRTRG